MDLSNKVALVTGAASGIGSAVSHTLAEAGATVAAACHNAASAERSAAELGAPSHGFTVELTDPESIGQLHQDVVSQLGLPDIIVNAAGFDRVGPFLDNDPELWERLVAVNLLAPVRLCHAFLTSLVAAEKPAKIINVSSDAGRVGSSGETVYAGAKGGLNAFTKSLAREMARYGVTVNCVSPGPTDTPLLAKTPEKVQAALTRAIPLRRVGTAQEVADAVAFFASPASDYLTGQILSVSGGLTMAD